MLRQLALLVCLSTLACAPAEKCADAGCLDDAGTSHPQTACDGGTCGSTGACSEHTCPTGCCDNGLCVVASQTNARCGRLGAACGACGIGYFCVQGSCQLPPQTCLVTCQGGCCDAETCVPYAQQNDNRCGPEGETCQKLPTNMACQFGGLVLELRAVCGGNLCGGGCCDNGSCLSFSSQTTGCGTAGDPCAPCAAGMTCQGGWCRGACSPTTCPDGCCNGDACVRATSQFPNRCGTGGLACAQCSGNQVCVDGECKSP